MKKTIDYLKENLKENSIIICATSGGPDSMVLLNLLLKLEKEFKLKIICAHVNHNLREESLEEYNFVKSFCKKNDIIFEGMEIKTYGKGNIEAEAHKKRYLYFDELVDKYNGNYLLTAHHGDDLIETILMKLTRGSSLESLIGFNYNYNYKNYIILRPLIFYTKNDILEYAKKNNIEYRIDKTNFDDNITRNRYRKKILPILKEEEGNIHLKYLKFSNELKENNEFIKVYVDKIYNKALENDKINIDVIKKENNYIKRKVIYKYLSIFYGSNIYLINQIHIDNILKIIYNKKPNVIIDLPLNIKIFKKYKYLLITKEEKKEDYKIELKKESIKVPYGTIKKIEKTSLSDNYVCHLYSKDINLPLYVRNRKDGDFIELLGLNKRKKVKDIFINEKIDIEKRSNYPIVVDAKDNMIWIPGIKKSKYDAIKTRKYDIILWYDKEE